MRMYAFALLAFDIIMMMVHYGFAFDSFIKTMSLDENTISLISFVYAFFVSLVPLIGYLILFFLLNLNHKVDVYLGVGEAQKATDSIFTKLITAILFVLICAEIKIFYAVFGTGGGFYSVDSGVDIEALLTAISFTVGHQAVSALLVYGYYIMFGNSILIKIRNRRTGEEKV